MIDVSQELKLAGLVLMGLIGLALIGSLLFYAVIRSGALADGDKQPGDIEVPEPNDDPLRVRRKTDEPKLLVVQVEVPDYKAALATLESRLSEVERTLAQNAMYR